MHYYQRARELYDQLVRDRRYLHQNPECGFDLPLTTRYVWERLTQMGLRPQMCGPAGITATIGRGAKTFLLRADMDALPLREESGLPFASTVERAHACGHDMHTAMLLTAAQMLRENEANLPGAVKLMFQPAEEILEGARSMIAAGVLQNPRVDAAMGVHMLPLAPTGVLLYNTGVVSASSDKINLTVTGRGGHGAQPHQTIDPINAAAHLHLALQALISREVDPAQAVVLTFGQFLAGEASNIIPEIAELRGSLRTYDADVRAYLLERIGEMARHTAEAFRAQASLVIPASTGSVVVDEATADTVSAALRELLGDGACVQMDERASESEDFAEIRAAVPAVFFFLGAGAQAEGYRYPLHNPRVTFNEEALPVGAAAYAQGATRWLQQAASQK